MSDLRVLAGEALDALDAFRNEVESLDVSVLDAADARNFDQVGVALWAFSTGRRPLHIDGGQK